MQTAVNNEPIQAYEGKVQYSGQYPTSIISKVASALIYFGKLVVPYAVTELAVGGAGPQRVKPPTSAAEILSALQGGGIAIADPTVERLRDPASPADPAPYGAFTAESAIPVMRRGLIWVVVETALTDITAGVYVRFQNAGGSPPAAQLGGFETAVGADFDVAPAGFAWQGAATIGSVNYALLEVNMS